jgi:peptidoglycan/LPS O-acetylase OafA/YrhL
MTATLTTVPTTRQAEQATKSQPVWKQGLVAGLAASVATTAVVVVARAIDVPVDAAGESIQILGFAQMTLLCTAIGILLARVIGRRAARPRALFTKVTVALTALSFVPDLTLDAGTATKVTLMLTHLVAAAIVIPALAGRLPERRAS